MTPSQARNAIKKCLQSIIDPKPGKTAVGRLWEYFGARCAYCGQEMERASRTGHVDHLIAETDGGANSIGNRVLSCGACNGDEKRELDWKGFLATKCQENPDLFNERRNKICEWIAMNGGPSVLSESEQQLLASSFDRINSVLTECVAELRQLRGSDDTA